MRPEKGNECRLISKENLGKERCILFSTDDTRPKKEDLGHAIEMDPTNDKSASKGTSNKKKIMVAYHAFLSTFCPRVVVRVLACRYKKKQEQVPRGYI